MSLDYDTSKKHREKFGGYNDFPPNWTECSEDEFWSKFMVYAATMQEYRQMIKGGKTTSAHLYFYSGDEGLALVQNYDYENHKHRQPKLYKFAACVHEWEELPARYNCYREYKCKKCGCKNAVDSSD